MAYLDTRHETFPVFPRIGKAAAIEAIADRAHWNGALERVALWRRRHSLRRQFARLLKTPHMIADIGLSRETLEREARKPFWRA